MDVERSYMKTVTSRLHFSLLWPSDKLLTDFLFNSFKAILNVVLIDSFVIFTTVKLLRVLSSSWIVIWIISLPSDIQPFFRSRNIRTLCKICWKLTVKTPRRQRSCRLGSVSVQNRLIQSYLLSKNLLYRGAFLIIVEKSINNYF